MKTLMFLLFLVGTIHAENLQQIARRSIEEAETKVVEAEEKCSDLSHRLVEVICETRESWWEALLLWLRNLGGSRGICDLLQRLLDTTNHLIHLVDCNMSSNPDPACKESSLLANLLSWLNEQDRANFDQMSSLSMALLVVLVIVLHLSLSFVVVALVNPFAYDFISGVYNTMEEKVVTKSRRTRSRSSRRTRSRSSRKARSSSSRRASSSSTRGTSSKTSRRTHSSTKSSSSVSKSMRTTSTAVYNFFKGFLTHVYNFFSSIVTFVYDIISGLFSTKEEKVVTKSRRTRSRSSRKARSSSSRRTSRSSTRRTSSKRSRRTHSSIKSSSSVSDGKQLRTVVFDFFSGLVTSVYNFFKSLFTFVSDFILGLFNTKEESVVTRTRRTSHSSTKSSHQLADEEPVKVVIKEEISKRPAASKKKPKSKESSNVYELDIFNEAQVVGSGNLDLISTSARPHLEGGPRGGD